MSTNEDINCQGTTGTTIKKVIKKKIVIKNPIKTHNYQTSNINDLELVYSLLRERYPERQIDIEYNDNTKEYKICLTNDKYNCDPEVNVDVDVKTIYGDTDSVFLSFKYNRDNFEKNRVDTFRLATICGDNITNLFNRNPICLEFEKVFQPFILITKKRYIGKKFEDTSDPFKLKTTTTAGTAVTRRDFANFTKKCYKEIIDLIMENKANALEDACELYKKYIDKLTNYQIDLQDIVISAQIGKEYSCKTCKKKVEWVLRCDKCKTLNPKMHNVCQGTIRGKPCKKGFECVHTFSLGHINLAQRQLYRNEEVQVGDRIQYIFVESENKGAQKNELAEDPVYAEKNGLKFNRGCYLEQLGKTLLAFFKITLVQRQDLLDDIIEYTNTNLIEFGTKKLKASDYKIDDDS
jgi:DNA polymerase elongation subunit (family B)